MAAQLIDRLRVALNEPPYREATDNLELEFARALLKAVGLDVVPSADREGETFTVGPYDSESLGLAFCVRHPDRWDVFDGW